MINSVNDVEQNFHFGPRKIISKSSKSNMILKKKVLSNFPHLRLIFIKWVYEEEEITQKYHFTRDIAVARVSALVHINVLTVLTLRKQLSHLEDYSTRRWDK